MFNICKTQKEEKLFFTREEIEQQFTKRDNFNTEWIAPGCGNTFKFRIKLNAEDAKKEILQKLNKGIDKAFYGHTEIDEDKIKIETRYYESYNKTGILATITGVFQNNLDSEVDEELQELLKYAVEKNDDTLKNKIETVIKKKFHSGNFRMDIA